GSILKSSVATIDCRRGGVKRNPSENIYPAPGNDGLRFAAPILRKLAKSSRAEIPVPGALPR
ncbi:MAG TPA: hypothetical protein VF243_07845, partial [Nitrosospira sp.]